MTTEYVWESGRDASKYVGCASLFLDASGWTDGRVKRWHREEIEKLG